MAVMRVSESAAIEAPPDLVYGIIADYRQGHPLILPPKHFGELVVERGGTGDGTLIRFTMKAFGKWRSMRSEVTEPRPGRVLAETDLAGAFVTTFTVEPRNGGGCTVTIATIGTRTGIAGFFDRLLAPGFLRAVYREELALLAKVAAERHTVHA